MSSPFYATRRAWAILSLLILLGPLLTSTTASSPAQPAPGASAAFENQGPVETPTSTVEDPPGEGPWVVRAYYADRQMVNELAAWREPWEVHYDQGYIVLDVTRSEYQRLREAGFELEIDQQQTARLNQVNVRAPGQTTGIPGYPCYRTVEETFDTAEAIVAAHPHLATWTDVGDSWEKTVNTDDGYDLKVLRLTNETVPGPKPKFFAMTSVHAREYAPAELGTRFAEYLVENYDVDPDVTWLLDYHEIHLLLQANPDGRKQAETGLSWRKNTNENYCSPTSNNRGADLNRNFAFQWGCCGGSSGYECDGTYRGPSAASEPETQAVQDYLRAQFPDQRQGDLGAAAPVTATGVFLDIHSYGQLMLWPWGFTHNTPPNGAALRTLGRKLAYFNDYEPIQAVDLYPTDGTTDDFAYGELGLAAYTFELGTSFFQDCAAFENTILPDNLPALVYAAKVARTPYLTPAGPDALNVTVSPAGASIGQTVQVTATLDDTRYNNQNGSESTQNVAAAAYYVDAPPWLTSTLPISQPMAAADGSFDDEVEQVTAALDTGGLSVGRHTLFVRGRDADGNWGAFSAAFFYVTETGVSPVITGHVRDIRTNLPLEATVTAGVFQTDTHPATGYYSINVLSGTYDLSAVAAGYVISTVADLTVYDYQTAQQDFYLYPRCGVLFDDVESGNQGWTTQSPWAITAKAAHSPSHSWTDSPGDDYANNRNTSLTSPVLDLTGHQGIQLSFWHTYDLEDGYDYGHVEYSTDGGDNWTQAATFSGQELTWRRKELDLPALDGQANARLRFRLVSDAGTRADGWHIDDILLSGGGLGCQVPSAEFTSDSPGVLGNAMTFTNLSTGSLPLDYAWHFGDGSVISTERDPIHIYPSSGLFTVTLTATNSLGSDQVSHAVTVLSPTFGVALSATPTDLTASLGQRVTYDLSIINHGNAADRFRLTASGNTWTTTLSITLTGELAPTASTSALVQVDVPLSASVGQTDTVTLTATSEGDGSVSDSLTLTTTAVVATYGTMLSPPTDTRAGFPGSVVTYTLTAHNISTVQDSFAIELLDGTWSATLAGGTTAGIIGPLAAGATDTLAVYVAIPVTATGGMTDTVTVKVTSEGDPSESASAQLTTRVKQGSLYLPLVMRTF